MKHTTTVYWIESIDTNDKISIVGHSQDDETDEIYYKFLDKKKAKKLMDDEKQIAPQFKYRLIIETTILNISQWEK